MGIALAESGQKTIVVDADFGGANLHQALGIPSPPVTIRDFLTKKHTDLNTLLLETFVPNLFLLSGTTHAMGLANIKFALKYRLIRQFRFLAGDFILLDIGAGTAFNELDFFIPAELGIVVITPEPLAIQNGYNFIKLCLLRRLARRFRAHPQVSQIIKKYIDPQDITSVPVVRLLSEEVKKLGKEIWHEWQSTIASFRPRIVINMLETQHDYEEGMAAVIAANDILGLQVHHLYHVHYDEFLRRAIKEGCPEKILDRQEGAVQDVRQMVQQLFFNKRIIVPSFKSNGSTTDTMHAKSAEGELFCSVQCSLWSNCSMQRGGYPCRIKVIGFVNQRQRSSRQTQTG